MSSHKLRTVFTRLCHHGGVHEQAGGALMRSVCFRALSCENKPIPSVRWKVVTSVPMTAQGSVSTQAKVDIQLSHAHCNPSDRARYARFCRSSHFSVGETWLVNFPERGQCSCIQTVSLLPASLSSLASAGDTSAPPSAPSKEAREAFRDIVKSRNSGHFFSNREIDDDVLRDIVSLTQRYGPSRSFGRQQWACAHLSSSRGACGPSLSVSRPACSFPRSDQYVPFDETYRETHGLNENSSGRG